MAEYSKDSIRCCVMKTIQPRKQRLKLYSTPLHKRKEKTSAHLSPELRKKYGMRAMPVRKGDTVKVMKGEEKGKEGKVSKVKPPKVSIEGITRSKTDGTKVFVPIHSSNLILTDVDLSDPKRKRIIERRVPATKPVEESEKPAKGGKK